jgi:hypothetical protein
MTLWLVDLDAQPQMISAGSTLTFEGCSTVNGTPQLSLPATQIVDIQGVFAPPFRIR